MHFNPNHRNFETTSVKFPVFQTIVLAILRQVHKLEITEANRSSVSEDWRDSKLLRNQGPRVEYRGIVNSSYRMVDASPLIFHTVEHILTLFGRRLVVKSETKESTWRETLPVQVELREMGSTSFCRQWRPDKSSWKLNSGGARGLGALPLIFGVGARPSVYTRHTFTGRSVSGRPFYDCFSPPRGILTLLSFRHSLLSAIK